MDFQYLLELAAKNQKNAEKQLPVTKRYSTKVPPPKKHERPTVDPNAIRARIEQKEKEKIRKAEEQERERIEGLKRQMEAEKKKKKERKSRSPKKSAFASASHVKETELLSSSDEESGRRQEKPRAEQKENAKAHKSFMQKIEREAERRREQEARREAESRPGKPKSIQKSAAPVPKKPMSFEELMKFAKDQQQGGGKSSAPTKKVEKEEDEEEEEDRREYKKSSKDLDRRNNHSAIKKGQLSKNNGEQWRTKTAQSGQAGKSSVPSGSGSQAKHKPSAGVGKGGALGKERRTNGEFVMKEKLVKGEAERQNVQSRDQETPSSSGKSKPRPSEEKSSKVFPGKVPSRPGERPSSSLKQGDNRLQGKPNEKPLSRPHPKQLQRSAGGSTSRDRPGPGERPPIRPGDGPRAKLDDKPRSGQRPLQDDPSSRPRSSGMGPPRSQEALRKRPAPSHQPVRMKVKQGRLCSDSEESDYDDGDGFIDDTPLEEMDCSNVSSYIKEIFGYDKSKYGYESDYALKSMDASYRDIQKEESRSARLGMLEDLEDMRKEREENRRKALAKKGKKR